MEIIKLANPAALDWMPIRELFVSAFQSAPAPFDDTMAAEIRELLESEWFHVLVGVENDTPKSLAIVVMPTLAIMPFPQVFLFYNTGTVALRNRTIDKVVETIKTAGYSRFWALIKDGDGRRLRAFKRAGTMNEFGTALEFTIA